MSKTILTSYIRVNSLSPGVKGARRSARAFASIPSLSIHAMPKQPDLKAPRARRPPGLASASAPAPSSASALAPASTPTPPTDLPIHSFATSSALEKFLEREHTTLAGFHLKLAKKSCATPSVTASEAVETALCFGWIDGRANRFDDDWWLMRYTPRRAKSLWSRKNVDTVTRLMADGSSRMRPAGLRAVEAAKMDGRWERAYAGPATMTVPDDFADVLARDAAATAFFAGLNKTHRYAVLWRVETASVKSRAGRIEMLVAMLAEGKSPHGEVKRATMQEQTPAPAPARARRTGGVGEVGKRKRPHVSSKQVEGDDRDDRDERVERRQPRRDGLRSRA